MKLGFNEATALECKGQSLMADLEMCEKYGFDYIEIRFDCVKDYLKEHTLEELADCKPVYEEFEGFSEDISSCKTFDELPEACKKYIARLEEVCGCKVVMVGNGPDRSQILER